MVINLLGFFLCIKVKIYVVAMEALKKKERQDETQFTTKVDGFFSFIPS